MSASWNKKRLAVPNLPPELWLHIFEFATFVPTLLETEVSESLSLTPTFINTEYASDEKFRQAVRASLITKRYLVRVSKQWHALATPLLYAAIYVGWERLLPSLRDTLAADADRARADATGTAPKPKGWWTRRLDLAMRAGCGDAKQHSPPQEPYSTALLQLIRYLPNLEILSSLWDHSFLVQSGPDFQSELALALQHTSAHTLRKLVWPNVYKIVNALTANSGGTVLRTVGSIPDTVDFPCPLAATFPSSLSYLWLAGDYSCAMPHVHLAPLPALHHLSVHDHHLVDLPCLADFLVVQGPLLNIMRVHIHTDHPEGFGALLLGLSAACPNMHRLVLSMDRWEELDIVGGGEGAILPNVTHLGLNLPNQGKKFDYRFLFKWLGDLKPHAEALRVVRFLNPTGWADLRLKHRRVFLEGLAVLAMGKMIAEDPAGNEVSMVGVITPQELQSIT